jgi:hypothetical protein
VDDETGQAIGRSRGGRTTKIHALCNQEGRPRAILLTGGNAADRGGPRTQTSVDIVPRRRSGPAHDGC